VSIVIDSDCEKEDENLGTTNLRIQTELDKHPFPWSVSETDLTDLLYQTEIIKRTESRQTVEVDREGDIGPRATHRMTSASEKAAACPSVLHSFGDRNRIHFKAV
jgi:hypothetical protein